MISSIINVKKQIWFAWFIKIYDQVEWSSLKEIIEAMDFDPQ